MIVLNICKEEINWKEAKNGKHYANVATDFLKQPDDKGNTHTVWNNQSQEERAELEEYWRAWLIRLERYRSLELYEQLFSCGFDGWKISPVH